MSHRRRTPVAQQKAQKVIEDHSHDSDRRDRFYGALLGAALVSIYPASASYATLAAFGIGFLLLFSLLLLGLKVEDAPIRFGQAFRNGFWVGLCVFGVLVGVIRVLG